MIGERNYMKDIKLYFNSYVMFGDDVKIRIFEKGRLDYPDFPCLNDVLFVDNLTTNLISISKLCD